MIQSYMAIYIVDVIALFFLLVLLNKDNILVETRKRVFILGIVLSIIVIIAEFGTILFNEGIPQLTTANKIFNVIGFLIAPTIPLVLMAIFEKGIIRNHLYLLIPTVLNSIAVLLSPFWGLVFLVSDANVYNRGQFFFIFIVAYAINIGMLVLSTCSSTKKHFYPIKWKIIGLSLFAILGTCVQLFFPSIYTTWHVATLTLFVLYIILSEFESSFDSLTELHNRAACEKAIRRTSIRKGFSVIVMDINNFKEVNDSYGHDYGDVVLKEVAASIRESFDNHCSFYRIGGDEFCVIRGDSNHIKLNRQLKNMSKSLTKKRQKNNKIPSVAYGFSTSEICKTTDYQVVMRDADRLMYMHKQKNNQTIDLKARE